MYLTVKQQLKHLSKDEFLSLRELSYNHTRLQSIKDKQKYEKKPTLRQKYLYASCNNKVNGYMSKTARKIIN